MWSRLPGKHGFLNSFRTPLECGPACPGSMAFSVLVSHHLSVVPPAREARLSLCGQQMHRPDAESDYSRTSVSGVCPCQQTRKDHWNIAQRVMAFSFRTLLAVWSRLPGKHGCLNSSRTPLECGPACPGSMAFLGTVHPCCGSQAANV